MTLSPNTPITEANAGELEAGDWPVITDAWVDTYCELTGRDPEGGSVSFIGDGPVSTSFRDAARREIDAMLCAAPKSAVRAIRPAPSVGGATGGEGEPEGMTEDERRRWLAGRHDWREDDWEDHCGKSGCDECSGEIPMTKPRALQPSSAADAKGVARKTMTLNLTDKEMAALEALCEKKDLSPPSIFRGSFRLYQAVEMGLVSVTWHETGPLGLPHTIDLRDPQPQPSQQAADEPEKALEDAVAYGVGFIIDGKRVAPNRVTVCHGDLTSQQAAPHCQLCGGNVEGWTCQTCEAEFHEVAGQLVLKSEATSQQAGTEGESLDDAARRLFAEQYPDRSYDDLKDRVQITWLRKGHKAILAARQPGEAG